MTRTTCRECLNRQNLQMTLKLGKTFGRSTVTSSIVITMNLEFNNNQGNLHKPGCVAKKVKMNIGQEVWTRMEVYQILGQDSQSSHY